MARVRRLFAAAFPRGEVVVDVVVVAAVTGESLATLASITGVDVSISCTTCVANLTTRSFSLGSASSPLPASLPPGDFDLGLALGAAPFLLPVTGVVVASSILCPSSSSSFSSSSSSLP